MPFFIFSLSRSKPFKLHKAEIEKELSESEDSDLDIKLPAQHKDSLMDIRTIDRRGNGRFHEKYKDHNELKSTSKVNAKAQAKREFQENRDNNGKHIRGKGKGKLDATDQHVIDSCIQANRYMGEMRDGVWVEFKSRRNGEGDD